MRYGGQFGSLLADNGEFIEIVPDQAYERAGAFAAGGNTIAEFFDSSDALLGSVTLFPFQLPSGGWLAWEPSRWASRRWRPER